MGFGKQIIFLFRNEGNEGNSHSMIQNAGRYKCKRI